MEVYRLLRLVSYVSFIMFVFYFHQAVDPKIILIPWYFNVYILMYMIVRYSDETV